MPFIAFEGLDGSGKSTLIRNLTAVLKQSKVQFLLTREPGGTKLAEEIRNILLKIDDEVPGSRTEALLYQASRAQHVDRVIRPALEKKMWILCDRFSASSIAFQSFARGLERTDIEWLNRFSTQNIFPDLNVLLDLTVEESHQRMQGRNLSLGTEHDRFEKEQSEFHQKVREGFLFQAKQEPQKWLVLNASQSSEKLSEQLISELKTKKYL